MSVEWIIGSKYQISWILFPTPGELEKAATLFENSLDGSEWIEFCYMPENWYIFAIFRVIRTAKKQYFFTDESYRLHIYCHEIEGLKYLFENILGMTP